MSNTVNLSMTSMAGPTGNIYDMSPYNSFSSSATSQHMGQLQSAAHLGGPQSMPFPAGNNGNSSMTSMPTGGAEKQSFSGDHQGNQSETNKDNQFDPSLFGENAFAQFGAIDLSSMEGMNNPFGSMAGGYTMLNESGNNNGNGGGGGAQPTPIPGRNNSDQMGGGLNGMTPGGNSFSANFIGGPSPADSNGSTSAFFAYTPAMMAADAATGNTGGGSALGPIGGEGSKKKKQEGFSELQLPPQQQSQPKNQ